MISHQAVQPASIVGNLLYNAGKVVDGATTLVEAPLGAALWSPDYAISTVLIGLRDPSIIGSLLSFVAQRYANPIANGFATDATYGLADIISVLPRPIGTWLTDALWGSADRVGSLFDILPDPTAGEIAFYTFVNDNFIGNIVDDINWLALAPVYSITDTVRYLGYLPYHLEVALETALRHPAEIPGVIANLVRGLVEPYDGLLGQIVDNFVAPLTYLPVVGAPIEQVYIALANVVQKVLDLLPTAFTPFAAVQKTAGESVVSAATAVVSAAPLAAANAVTLDVPKTAEDVTPEAGLEPKLVDTEAKASDTADVVAADPVKDPVEQVDVPSVPAAPPSDVQSPAAPAAPEPTEDGDTDTGDAQKAAGKRGDKKGGSTGRHHREDKVDDGTDGAKAAPRASHRGDAGGGRHRADEKKDAPSAGAADSAGEKADAAA